MAAREIRTPLTFTPAFRATELGNNVWWKQVLPANKRIKYGDRWIDFNEDYCRRGEEAFRRHAFDTNPFVLAPADNSHTMAAQNGAHGKVLAAKVDMDAKHPKTGDPAPGLYYALSLSDEADEIVRANDDFGVSLRMKESYTRADGEHFDVAPQHVLGTWDPVLTGMSPWQPYDGQAGDLDLSNPPGTAVIDLSGLTFEPTNQEGADDVTAPQNTTTDTGQGDAPPAWFQSLIDSGAITLNGQGGQPDEQDGDEQHDDDGGSETGGNEPGGADEQGDDGEFDPANLSDEEWDQWLESEVLGAATDEAGHPDTSQAQAEPAEVAASNGYYGGELDLSNGYDDPRVVELSAQNTALAQRLDAAEYEKESDELVRRTGLPPHVIEMARPLLEGTGHVVELSNDADLTDRERAGQVVRAVFDEIGSLHKLLDLSEPQLAALAPVEDEETEKATHRSNYAAMALKNAGLG